MSETFPGWAEIDAWRSVFYALAAKHGDDPMTAAARHREWSIRMGYEPAPANDNGGGGEGGRTPVAAAVRPGDQDTTLIAHPVAAPDLAG